MKKLGFSVTPHAYGIPTSFEAEYGSGGRLVVFNAEYDALPEIGHACGHNLIATGSFAGFIAAAAALRSSGKPGRVRLLGTPAEEGGCGKGMLIAKGAYKDVDACIMAHPSIFYDGYGKEFHGRVFAPHVAVASFTISFTGKTTHAAASPWDGVNALDAIVLGYNAVSMMRQQMRPTDRVHGVIMDGGLRSNIIPNHSSVDYCVRAVTIEALSDLRARTIECFRAGAVATGCTMDVVQHAVYAGLQPNRQLSKVFAESVEALGIPMTCEVDTKDVIAGGTDQGNVGCVVPVIHPIYGIEAGEKDFNHTIGFTEASGKAGAFERTLLVGNGLARTAWAMLVDDDIASAVKKDFDEAVALRRRTISAEDELAMITAWDQEAYAKGETPTPTRCACGHLQ